MHSLKFRPLHWIEAIHSSLVANPLVLVACSLFALGAGGRVLALGASVQASVTGPQSEEDADELRHQELVGRRADVTVLRLNEVGEAVARLDLHFGRALPKTAEELLATLNQFEVEGELVSDFREKDRHYLTWRNVILPAPSAPLDQPELTFFDPEADLAIEFRRADAQKALTCKGGFAVAYGGFGSAGKNIYWYPTGDAITATAGSGVQSGADPDLYLSVWNGSSYVVLTSSTAYGPDTVFAIPSNCQSNKWRLRVHMALPGTFFVGAIKFIANQ
jgi:hypothetical protein